MNDAQEVKPLGVVFLWNNMAILDLTHNAIPTNGPGTEMGGLDDGTDASFLLRQQPSTAFEWLPDTDTITRRNKAGSLVGNSAVSESVVTADPEFNPETSEIMVLVGNEWMKIISYFDGNPIYATLTEKIVEGRRREYQNHGLLEQDAERDNIRGSNVEFFAVIDPETQEPIASLRKIHIASDAISTSPSYRKFMTERAFDPAALADFHARAQNRQVVEIAALWKDDRFSTEVKVELYKAALHSSARKGELWLMGIVQGEYAGLKRSYGEHVVHTLGEPVAVKGEGARDTVRLRPVMVDPVSFFEDMLDEVSDANSAGNLSKMLARGQLLADFLIGFDWNLLDLKTRGRLETAINGDS